MFTAGTYVVLLIVFAVFGYFLLTLYIDLRDEERKNRAIAEFGEDGLDPYLFSGEKARREARALYLSGDPICRAYFDELGVTKFLRLDEGTGGDANA